jgi:hypothetical protein
MLSGFGPFAVSRAAKRAYLGNIEGTQSLCQCESPLADR